MSHNRDASVEQYARNLTTESYPKADDLSNVPNTFRRKWMLRVSTNLPADDVLEGLVRSFEQSARLEIAKALGATDNVMKPLPSVGAFRLDDFHLILEIDCPSPEAKMGDAAAIATFVVLRAADQQWQVEDLQGIPKRYWLAMG